MTRPRPMRQREAVEAAAAWLRRGRVPPKDEADRIATALDMMAIGYALGGEPIHRDAKQRQEA